MLSSSSIHSRTPILHPRLLPSLKPTISSFTLHSISNPHFRNPSFLKPPPLLETRPLENFLLHAKSPPADKPSEQKWTHEGLITESLPNGMFRVRLDNEDLILGYVSGKIRKNFVRILPGDRVKVEVSRYDSSKGRIVYRLRSSS